MQFDNITISNGVLIDSVGVPNAPSVGTVVIAGSYAVSVPFTASTSDGNSPITSYTAVSSPGNITGTINQAGSGTISVSGLSPNTNYTFTVYATNAKGNSLSSSESNQVVIVHGQIEYTTPGTYSWTVPTGISSISVVTIGGGGAGYTGSPSRAGGGAALAYVNNISCTPGETFSVVAGNKGLTSGAAGGFSSVTRTSNSTIMCKANGGGGATASTNGQGGTIATGTGGGVGGNGGSATSVNTNTFTGGGGGAGGYSGNGGVGGSGGLTSGGTGAAGGLNSGAGGGGSGAGGGAGTTGGGASGGTGGGVGIYGIGSTGAAVSWGANQPFGTPGNPGSGGSGNLYGGGGAYYNGGTGAVRIIWPGDVRQFPSTLTTDQ